MNKLLSILLTCCATSMCAQHTTPSDQWTATDALGRKVPSYNEVGPKRTDKYVGIFYCQI